MHPLPFTPTAFNFKPDFFQITANKYRDKGIRAWNKYTNGETDKGVHKICRTECDNLPNGEFF